MPTVHITTTKVKEHSDETREQIAHHVSDGETTVMVSSVEELDSYGTMPNLSILDVPEGYILHESMGFYVDDNGKINWLELFCLRPANHEKALNIVKISLAAMHVSQGEEVIFVNEDE